MASVMLRELESGRAAAMQQIGVENSNLKYSFHCPQCDKTSRSQVFSTLIMTHSTVTGVRVVFDVSKKGIVNVNILESSRVYYGQEMTYVKCSQCAQTIDLIGDLYYQLTHRTLSK